MGTISFNLFITFPKSFGSSKEFFQFLNVFALYRPVRYDFTSNNPSGIFLLEVNKWNARTKYEIYSRLTRSTRTTSMTLLLTLNIFHRWFWCFHCWLHCFIVCTNRIDLLNQKKSLDRLVIVAKGFSKLPNLHMLIKQKSPSLPRNLAVGTFGELLIVFSTKVNLLYLL